MKRYTVVRVLTKAMEDGDIGIFIGNSICKEAFAYDRPGNLYVGNYENMISLGLGMAMCTNRRVFIFCDDAYFLRNLSEAAHIAVSKCENLYLVVLVSGNYNDVGKHPTIFKSISSPHGFLFGMGFIVHDYKRHFKNLKSPIKEIKATWRRIRGPLAVVIDVDYVNKNTYQDYLNEKVSIERIMSFVNNEDIPTYKFVPPISFEEAFSKEI